MINYSIWCFSSFIFFIPMSQTISVISKSGACFFYTQQRVACVLACARAIACIKNGQDCYPNPTKIQQNTVKPHPNPSEYQYWNCVSQINNPKIKNLQASPNANIGAILICQSNNKPTKPTIIEKQESNKMKYRVFFIFWPWWNW